MHEMKTNIEAAVELPLPPSNILPSVFICHEAFIFYIPARKDFSYCYMLILLKLLCPLQVLFLCNLFRLSPVCHRKKIILRCISLCKL